MLQTQFLPETDLATIDNFRVEGPLAIRNLLRELVRKKALIVLYDVRDHGRFVTSQLAEVDGRGLQFEFVAEDPRRRSILAAGEAVVVGFLEQIKIQFDAKGITAVAGGDGLAVRCPMPRAAYRIQRRDAYRVRPLATDEATVHVHDGHGGERAYRVIDMSASGVAFAIAPDAALPTAGEHMKRCRIGFAERPPIPCELFVRHVSEGLPSEGGMRRIGCEYGPMPPEIARAMQLTVLDFETRAARMR